MRASSGHVSASRSSAPAIATIDPGSARRSARSSSRKSFIAAASVHVTGTSSSAATVAMIVRLEESAGPTSSVCGKRARRARHVVTSASRSEASPGCSERCRSVGGTRWRWSSVAAMCGRAARDSSMSRFLGRGRHAGRRSGPVRVRRLGRPSVESREIPPAARIVDIPARGRSALVGRRAAAPQAMGARHAAAVGTLGPRCPPCPTACPPARPPRRTARPPRGRAGASCSPRVASR